MTRTSPRTSSAPRRRAQAGRCRAISARAWVRRPCRARLFSASFAQHLLDLTELHPGALARFATAFLFEHVDQLPVVIADEVGAPLPQQPLEHRPSGDVMVVEGPGCGSPPAATSTVSWESGLLVPMMPVGPRLIQPTTYSAGTGSPVVGIDDPPTLVGDDSAGGVEREPEHRHALVTDRPEHQVGVHHLGVAGHAGAQRAAVGRDQARSRRARGRGPGRRRRSRSASAGTAARFGGAPRSASARRTPAARPGSLGPPWRTRRRDVRTRGPLARR